MTSDTREPLASTEHMVDYDRNSRMQDQMVLSKSDLLHETVERIGVVSPEFVMADYGCGPGHSALDAVRPVVEAYRKMDATAPMAIRHCDQPGNDWNGLFGLVFGPDGYRKDFAGIRSEAAVGSFYTQIAEPGSVALATTFAASHWLSRSLSLNSPDTVWFADLEGDARVELADLARSDWTRFLRARATELRPGGYAIISTLGAVPDAREKNGVRASGSRLYRALHTIARQMVDDGLLAQAALDGFVFSLWFQTVDEAREPIETEADLAEAFEIVDATVTPAPHSQDVYGDKIGDPVAYGELYAGYVRGFAESSLRLHLFGPSANSAADVDALNEEFFRRLELLYRDSPGKHASETMIITIVLRRRL